MDQRKRINSIEGIKRRKKRTRNARSFRHDTFDSFLDKKEVKTQNFISKKVKPKKRVVTKKTPTKLLQSRQNYLSSGISFFKTQWFWLRYIIWIFVISIGIVIFFNTREKTYITIRPHHEYMNVDTNIMLHKNPQEDELGFDIIAIHDEVSIPIIAEGIRDVQKKSSGVVTIYNNYSTEPQRLLAETRFQSAGGKIFKLGTDEVIIPGKQQGSPGTIQVTLYADQSGSEYNIDSTDFTIPGFKEVGLDEKYNTIYAVSEERFSGGYSGTEPYITDIQKEALEEELRKKLRERLVLRLEHEKTDQLMLVKESAQIDIQDSYLTTGSDGNGDRLVQPGTIIAVLVGLDEFIFYIEDVLNTGEIPEFIIDDINDASITQYTEFDFESDDVLEVTIQGELFTESLLDEDILKQTFNNQSFDDLGVVFNSMNTIDRLHVVTRPFWKKKVSNDISRIFISYE